MSTDSYVNLDKLLETLKEKLERRADRAKQKRAENWGKRFKTFHSFDTTKTTMWYDNRRDDGRVTDITYNDGSIKRILHDHDDKVVYFDDNKREGNSLVDLYQRIKATKYG
jgi:hypothetical protein